MPKGRHVSRKGKGFKTRKRSKRRERLQKNDKRATQLTKAADEREEVIEEESVSSESESEYEENAYESLLKVLPQTDVPQRVEASKEAINIAADDKIQHEEAADEIDSTDEDEDGSEDQEFNVVDDKNVTDRQNVDLLRTVDREHALFNTVLTDDHTNAILKRYGRWSSPETVGDVRIQATASCELLKSPPSLQSIDTVSQMGIPSRMLSRYILRNGSESLSGMNKLFSAALSTYSDVLCVLEHNSPLIRETRDVLTAWMLAHIVRARARLLKNNLRLKQHSQSHSAQSQMIEVRDQGFTRPRALVLLPFREHAYEFVTRLIALKIAVNDSDDSSQVMNRKKFQDHFHEDDPEVDIDRSKKPDDYWETFKGNVDDDFMLGVQIGNKAVRLFSDYSNSDVIVASPLGLRRYLDDHSSVDEHGKRSVGDCLSSIEILIIDNVRSLAMQNWDHLNYVMSHMNELPGQVGDTDFSRVRNYFLDKRARMYRQSIIISDLLSSRIMSLFRNCENHLGKYMLRDKPSKGSYSAVVVKARQVFNRIDNVSNPSVAADVRFQYFQNAVLTKLRSSASTRVLLFVPSYFDFVRLRNLFIQIRKESGSFQFAAISETSRGPDITRARSRFYHAQVDYLLMTERFHYHYRYRIRGARMLIFYGLPENEHFYPELINLLEPSVSSSASVVALFDKYDRFPLERIVGEKRADMMLSNKDKDVFLIY
mmetsp:Transcript_3518/g.10636  ORF Transcript_3518/g.10636 Transcript_3518/m.10636 type:complete len:712 (+) Transcript_3518:45-2180(+)